MPNPIIERAARAACIEAGMAPDAEYRGGHTGFDWNWQSFVPEVCAVLRAIHEPLSDAVDYLFADAGAWETGAKDHPHEVYLMHCGKLRRDVASRLQTMIDVALADDHTFEARGLQPGETFIPIADITPPR
jgi:hypothetical protein